MTLDSFWLRDAESYLRNVGAREHDVARWAPVLAERLFEAVDQVLQDAYDQAVQADGHAHDLAIERRIDERRGA